MFDDSDAFFRNAVKINYKTDTGFPSFDGLGINCPSDRREPTGFKQECIFDSLDRFTSFAMTSMLGCFTLFAITAF